MYSIDPHDLEVSNNPFSSIFSCGAENVGGFRGYSVAGDIKTCFQELFREKAVNLMS